MNRNVQEAPLVPPSGWLDADRDGQPGEGGTGLQYLLLMTGLGLVVRAYGLMSQSLWVDEMLTWKTIRPGAGLHFLEQILDSIQGPLYMAIVWPLVRIGDPALMMRLPSLIAGVLAVPLFGVLVSGWLGRRAARLALLLFALNPFLIHYSQEGRGYSLMMLWLLAAVLVHQRMVRRGPTAAAAVAMGVLGAAAALSNLSLLFLWTAMAVGVLLLHRPSQGRDWLMWALGFGLTGVLVSPWLLQASGIWAVDRIVPGAGTGELLRGETTFTWLALPYSFFNFLYGNSFGPSLRELHQPDRLAAVTAWAPLLVVGALPAGIGLLVALLRPTRRLAGLWLWIAIPLALLVLLALRNFKPWNPRYVLVVLPWVLILTAYGLSRLPVRAGLALAALWTGLTLWSLGNYYWNGRYAKADVRGAVERIEAENELQWPILAPAVTPVVLFYHGGSAEVLGAYEWDALTDAVSAREFCDERLAGIDECWVVLAREWYFDPHGRLLPALAGSGRLVLVEERPGTRLYRWSRLPGQG